MSRAILVLADGSQFEGRSIGASGQAIGEVVFNTSMTGYQEIITDPSYAAQMVVLTTPHIGNVGVNSADQESNKPWLSGLIIRDYPKQVSNWRSEQPLADYLKQHGVVAIADIDTRRLTRLIRDRGAQLGCIVTDNASIEQTLAKLKQQPSLLGQDLASVVSTAESYEWDQFSYGFDSKLTDSDRFHVVVYDYGVKQQILRLLVDRDCRVTVVPAQTSADDVLAMKPDGVLLSNGPGDPAACTYAVEAIKRLMVAKTPLFGICLGHQLFALACGGQTMKMKFGHHGGNHPVKDLATGKVMITSQNHGFAVDQSQLPSELEVTHVSLFDQTIQGLRLRDYPGFSVQGHPEASPGPSDFGGLFDQFIHLMSGEHAKT